MKKILFGLMALGVLTACKDSYDDYAAPQKYDPETAVNVQIAFTPTSQSINMNTDADKDIALFNYTTQNTEVDNVTATIILVDPSGQTQYNDTLTGFSKDGVIYVADNDVERAFGAKYGSHNTSQQYRSEVKADIVAHTANGDGVFFEENTSINLQMATLPEYSDGYKVTVDGVEGGKLEKQADGTYKATVTTKEPNSSILFWAVNGSSEEMLGTYIEDNSTGYGGIALGSNAKTINIVNPGDYIVTLDTKFGLYSVVSDQLFYVGDATGWGFMPMSGGADGWFTGYYYVNLKDGVTYWGFKFAPESNWDIPSYGYSPDGKDRLLLGTNENLLLPDGYEPGFYKIRASKKELRYTLEPITSMSLVGDAVGGWGNDVDMKYDADNKCWTVTTEFTAAQYKIRANHGWAIAWGVKDGGGFTTQDGATNMSIETAGKYTIKFAPECEGKGRLTLEAAE